MSVAETEHLTQSAQSLFVTQSTLSHGLKQLEAELGVSLFDRVGRGLKLSQAGMVFKGYAGRALQELAAGQMELLALNGLQAGTLTIGVIPTFMDTLVPAAVARFSEAYPKIRITILDLRADLIEDYLQEGQLDMGIAFHPTRHPDIHTQHLFTEELKLVVNTSHPLAATKETSFQSLKTQPLCLLPRSFATRRILDNSFQISGVEPLICVEMESVSALIACCEEGRLATIVPERAATMNPHMCTISLTDPTPVRHAGILWRRGAKPSMAVQAFVKILQGDLFTNSIKKVFKKGVQNTFDGGPLADRGSTHP